MAGIDDEAVHIRIGAQPQDGMANDELCRFLAKEVLSIRKSAVVVDRGATSRHKIVLVSDTTVAHVAACCHRAMAERR